MSMVMRKKSEGKNDAKSNTNDTELGSFTNELHCTG